MSDITIQASFNSGEWAPALYARVDLQKYRSGAKLLENFFVDYRGGASTRPGTKYIIQAYKSSTAVRLIRFQAAFNVGYIMEFGDYYIRFIFNGSPVLENSFAIIGASQANPCVLNIPSNNYVIGDWIFVDYIVGMTQLNGRYFSVTNVAGALVTIADLNGVPINSTAFTVYASGGTTARIYKITSPYAAADLALVKFSQSINQMILCHPSYPTYVLSLVTAINWTLVPIVIGSTASAPGPTVTNSTLSGGTTAIGYEVTSIDTNGQESSASAPTFAINKADMQTTPGSNLIEWSLVSGDVAYNVYKSDVSFFNFIPVGTEYGFIGTCQGTQFVDTNISPDFSQTPPVFQDPFAGSGISNVVVTVPGTYTTVPTVTATGVSPTIPASLLAVLQVQGTPTVGAGGSGYALNDTVLFPDNVVLVVASVSGGAVTAWKSVTSTFSNPGAVSSGSVSTNPVSQISTSGAGTGATANLTWGVGLVQVLASGAGYSSVPTMTFSSGAAAATATLAPTSNGYPSVPGFFQQRLVLAAPNGAPQTFYMSQPGNYYNFNISSPSEAGDAITGTLVSGVLNSIKSIVSSTAGMLILTDQASWIVNGGSSGSAVSPSAIVANAQSFIGANDVPPIIANYDILYVQSKGSGVRDLSYNIYFNVFTGTDISILASHLFFGYEILEWAWAEAPFYVVWAVRNDGQMLTLTYLKEQDFIGWSHQITNGTFTSVATVTENTALAGNVDAVYTVVQRLINGNSVKYIERVAERIFPDGVSDAWCVDSALSYEGTAQSAFSAAEHLAGVTCTGLSDGVIIPPFVMPVSGQFTIPVAGTKVVVGEAYTCDLETLALELGGQENIQGKVKKIPSVDVRVADTLGLSIGNDFNYLTPMKDLVQGNVSSMLTGQEVQIVTDLVDGDARTFLGPTYTVPGQYCIRQSLPYPATVLGVFPAFVIGDDR